MPVEVRKTIGRLRNCIKLLAHHSIMISPTSVMTAFDMSIEQEFEVSWFLCSFLKKTVLERSLFSLFYISQQLWELQCSSIFQVYFRIHFDPYLCYGYHCSHIYIDINLIPLLSILGQFPFQSLSCCYEIHLRLSFKLIICIMMNIFMVGNNNSNLQ